MTQLDFSPFKEPLTKEDYEGLPNNPASLTNIAVICLGIGVGLVTVIFSIMIGMTSVNTGEGFSTLFLSLFICAIFFAAGFILIFGLYLQRKKRARFEKFARRNNLKYRYDTLPITQIGLIFDEGHTRKINQLFRFPDGVELGNYEFVTGSGKNRVVRRYAYARIALSRHLPNMVLDARSNNFFGFSNLPDVFHKSQRLSLEGNFNDFFDVYVPTGYERDALYVFTPDVMQVLIEHGKKYDLEVVDNELYIYQSGVIDFSSEKSFNDMLDVVSAVSQELRDQTKRYSDERLPQSLAGTAVGEKGRRLKSSVNYYLIALVAGYFILQIGDALLPRSIANVVWSLFGIGLLLFVVYVCFKAIQRRP